MNALKLLVVIASYGRRNDSYLRRLIHEYRSFPYHCDIVVCCNIKKPVPDGVELVVGMPTPDPWSLPFGHKKIMAERVDNYDLFIYSEDDTLATQSNIEAFLRVIPELCDDEVAGFLRYEQCPDGTIRFCDVNGHYHWDHTSVLKRGTERYAFFTNEHAAFYILTRSQLKRAIHSGGFLVQPHHGKYDLACSAATDVYTQCGFHKLVCISRLRDFLLHHLPNKYIGTEFGTSELLFEMQLSAMIDQSADWSHVKTLVPAQTQLRDAWYSKNYYEPVNPRVLDAIPASARHVLTVGCGSGETERELVRRGMDVCAACLDPVIAACARSSSIETVCGDPEQVCDQLSGRTFDVLVVTNVLHLAPRPEDMLNLFLKQLNPGGTCVIATPNLRNAKILLARIRGDEAFLSIGDYQQSGTNILTASQVSQWLSSCGIVQIRTMYLFPARRKRVASLSGGLFNSILASDIIITGHSRPSHFDRTERATTSMTQSAAR